MRVIFLIYFLIFTNKTQSQILDNSLFRIYRATFINGAVTHLKIDKDASYDMVIAEIHCSLCDHEELNSLINSKGTWTQGGDTIYLDSETGKRIILQIASDSLLKPVFPIGFNLDTVHDSIKTKAIQAMQKIEIENFHLIYDTYPNGVARFIIDRYRMRRSEYEIEFKSNGTLNKIKYYWDNKETNKIR